MDFSEKLKTLRKEKNLTQEELAEAINVSRVTISKWETGRGYPNLDSLQLLSKRFSVSINDLLSTGELMVAAKEEMKEEKIQQRIRFSALVSCSSLLLLFLPIFRSNGTEGIRTTLFYEVEGLSKSTINCFAVLSLFPAIGGLLALVLTSLSQRRRQILTLGTTFLSALLFSQTYQPYPTALCFFLLALELILCRNE